MTAEKEADGATTCAAQQEGTEEAPSERRRGLTSLTLQWLAERIRKADRIKEQIAEGKYEVKSEKVASALLNEEDK